MQARHVILIIVIIMLVVLIWYNRNKWKNKHKVEGSGPIGNTAVPTDYSILSLYISKSKNGKYFVKVGGLGSARNERDLIFGEIKSHKNSHRYLIKQDLSKPNGIDDIPIYDNNNANLLMKTIDHGFDNTQLYYLDGLEGNGIDNVKYYYYIIIAYGCFQTVPGGINNSADLISTLEGYVHQYMFDNYVNCTPSKGYINCGDGSIDTAINASNANPHFYAECYFKDGPSNLTNAIDLYNDVSELFDKIINTYNNNNGSIQDQTFYRNGDPSYSSEAVDNMYDTTPKIFGGQGDDVYLLKKPKVRSSQDEEIKKYKKITKPWNETQSKKHYPKRKQKKEGISLKNGLIHKQPFEPNSINGMLQNISQNKSDQPNQPNLYQISINPGIVLNNYFIEPSNYTLVSNQIRDIIKNNYSITPQPSRFEDYIIGNIEVFDIGNIINNVRHNLNNSNLSQMHFIQIKNMVKFKYNMNKNFNTRDLQQIIEYIQINLTLYIIGLSETNETLDIDDLCAISNIDEFKFNTTNTFWDDIINNHYRLYFIPLPGTQLSAFGVGCLKYY